MKRIRLGAGAGFSGDRIEPAIELAERGALNYLIFECLAERTIALAQQARRIDPSRGYDPLLEPRMRAVLPICVRQGVKIISNMGAANPLGAARRIAQIAHECGLSGLKIAAVTGDDVLDQIRDRDFEIEESERPGRRSRRSHHLGQRLSGGRTDRRRAGAGRRYRGRRPFVRSRIVPRAIAS